MDTSLISVLCLCLTIPFAVKHNVEPHNNVEPYLYEEQLEVELILSKCLKWSM